MPIHPLIFEPILKPKVWGGRKLQELLGKPLPADTAIGESWECADLPVGRSVVKAGPSKGRTLSQLVTEWGRDLTGRVPLVDGGFPLLIKFLDARQTLSVQVHPGPTYARRVGGLKHEAWYVLDAEPGAVIYRGLRPGVTRADLAAAAAAMASENPLPFQSRDRKGAGGLDSQSPLPDGRGSEILCGSEIASRTPSERIADLFQRVPVKAGQCLYCPSGMPHALGAGIVVAEIQTPSDVTYRLYDWGRQRPTADAGLHVEQALDAIEWNAPPTPEPPRSHVGGLFTMVSRLVTCDAFTIEKVRFSEGMLQDMPYDELVIWIVLQGRGAILYGGGASMPFARGDVVILPAALPKGQVRTDADCVWLEVTVPVPSDLAAFERPTAKELRDESEKPTGTIPLNISRMLPRGHDK